MSFVSAVTQLDCQARDLTHLLSPQNTASTSNKSGSIFTQMKSKQLLNSDDCLWPYQQMEVFEAWSILRNHGHRLPGQGITVAQLDTGIIPTKSLQYTSLVSQGRDGLQQNTQNALALNFNLVTGRQEPFDDDPHSISFGHGTTTASVLIGWNDFVKGSDFHFRGVAPWIKFIPIKVTDSVVMVGHTSTQGTADLKNMAEGVTYSTSLGADVITVSLGGLFDTEQVMDKPIQEAINGGAIIVAAGGQGFHANIVPIPARMPGVIAVTASTKHKNPWKLAFFGEQMAWAAPGVDICHIHAKEIVHRNAQALAGANPVRIVDRRGELRWMTDEVMLTSGSSYSTAFTAAAAALWLQFHSPTRLRSIYGSKNISALFAKVAKRYAMDTPSDWNAHQFGQGILNIRKLIEAPLPCSESDSKKTCKVKTERFLNFELQ
jgi:hypothetical protein